MNFLTLSIAWRYIRFKKKDKNISIMMKICFLGILIGSFALMMTLIITNGFEKAIHEKIQGISAQVIINYPANKLDPASLRQMFAKDFSSQVEDCSGGSDRQIILNHDKNQTLILLKGVEPAHEQNVTNISSKIISHYKNLEGLLKENQIIIGEKIASAFKLKVGDTVSALVPQEGTKTKIYLKKVNIIIAGIFKVGLEEYDSGCAFCNLKFLNELFEEQGADQVSLKLKEENKSFLFSSLFTLKFYKNFFANLFSYKSQTDLILEKIKKRLPGFNVQTWQDLYPALVSSLKLEKYGMSLLLALIVLVASMNMISLLFILIQQKRRDIAIFKTMGMNNKKIQNIFLAIGMTITFLGTSLGLFFAGIAGYLLEKYPIFKLPDDVYYVSHLPARMDIEIFIVVFVCTILLGFLATWIPAKRTKFIKITEVLRME
ncbi:TPA: hypothetical protein DEO28_03575 [Candidatus Dependentiae bacterium]|nr:MAG: hypothetical protein UR14_C0007G0016 [candidate division TM6 bacterium GW2011_GWE2_31_21]KKP53623.1 MAG: hypothetical protein UR43_C0004G0164 [candidate division TM6 bacterium GW2011_GWF2_33_332]HBS48137.1 hypothetical protein [Candidatus Dependentiae bacterium]HBZ73561.1 hypothetical protein [Candidatus Dependentiae bacterium]